MSSTTTTKDEHFHDQCGIFGVYGSEEAANFAYLGLHSLQHRGQESAGIATANHGRLLLHLELGLVRDSFTEETLRRLPGRSAIGHVRYSTAGETRLREAQPIAVDYALGSIAVAHNGNLTNYLETKQRLESAGSIFHSTSDSEVLVHLIAHSKEQTAVNRVVEALQQVRGAFSLLFLTPNELIAVRDPHGFRPLCIGRSRNAYLFSSEPPAFDLLAAEFLREVEPGELVVVDKSGLRSFFPFAPVKRKMCIFEYIYFARPDSTLDGVSVYEARKRFGRALAQEQPAQADLVIPIPDSGVPAALGYAEQMNLPFEFGLIRSHYIGRTFIEPESSIRHFGVRLKLSPVRSVLNGKRLVVVDDSIIRGTTSQKIVKMLRDAGAREVHLRISSPPSRWPCYYGIDTPSTSELIASSLAIAEINKFITSDSLGYLSIEGLHRSIGGNGYCDACFTGEYPVEVRKNDIPQRQQLKLIGI
ncbi:MAG: amidophosphoribosyltransferase [Deltaproteobacteria bacterium]|nr:amidophosphoribosyltransferase [Deltaproteobacteria bacterium]